MRALPENLQVRVNQLPPKVAKTLGGLFEIGHIDASVLTSVLDAGDLSQDVSRLSAFAVSFLFLSSQQVPVKDVIRMAKQNDRTIHLWWSARRWQAEHERLSLLATVTRLCAENATYETAFFASHIAPGMPGYLVRSSRRLGMEGLRQRHCVASWHDRLSSGNTAICVVFLNTVRWTVELIRTQDPKHPVRVGQIKARRNADPCFEERKRIHQLLGISEQTATPGIGGNAGTTLWQRNAAIIIPVLRELSVEQVEVRFSGYGDSGQIEEVWITPDPGAASVTVTECERYWDAGTWQSLERSVERPLADAITDMVYAYLEITGVNWYDNEGGSGVFTMDVTRQLLAMEIDVHYRESSTEFAREIGFAALLEEVTTASLGTPECPTGKGA